jgi:hypothetical protein
MRISSRKWTGSPGIFRPEMERQRRGFPSVEAVFYTINQAKSKPNRLVPASLIPGLTVLTDQALL